MNCNEIQAQLLYLAEDEPDARQKLEEHLAFCTECSRKWKEYRLLLSAYESACSEESPPMSLRRTIRIPWRLIRIAALVAVAICAGFFWPGKMPRSMQPQVQNQAVLSWDPPPAVSTTLVINSQDQDFQARIDSVQDGITRLRMQTSSNEF